MGNTLHWLQLKQGFYKALYLPCYFFLIYIYDLSNDLVSNAKLFADDTSLFFVVEKMPKPANDLNHDLAKIRFC